MQQEAWCCRVRLGQALGSLMACRMLVTCVSTVLYTTSSLYQLAPFTRLHRGAVGKHMPLTAVHTACMALTYGTYCCCDAAVAIPPVTPTSAMILAPGDTHTSSHSAHLLGAPTVIHRQGWHTQRHAMRHMLAAAAAVYSYSCFQRMWGRATLCPFAIEGVCRPRLDPPFVTNAADNVSVSASPPLLMWSSGAATAAAPAAANIGVCAAAPAPALLLLLLLLLLALLLLSCCCWCWRPGSGA
jgi:hypothetical protein